MIYLITPIVAITHSFFAKTIANKTYESLNFLVLIFYGAVLNFISVEILDALLISLVYSATFLLFSNMKGKQNG